MLWVPPSRFKLELYMQHIFGKGAVQYRAEWTAYHHYNKLNFEILQLVAFRNTSYTCLANKIVVNKVVNITT